MVFLYPELGENVKVLEGKEVEIRGYMIPVDPAVNIIVLSAYRWQPAFFVAARAGIYYSNKNEKAKKVCH